MNNILINTLIIVALSLVVIIPIIVVGRSSARKRKEKGLLKFAEICKKSGLSISDPDYFGLKLIGIDPAKKVLVYLDNYSVESPSQLIDLKKVNHCEVLKKVANGEVTELGIGFDGHGTGRQTVLFYKQYRDKSSHLKEYEVKAEEWKTKALQALPGLH